MEKKRNGTVVSVDYPRHNERLLPGGYTFRIGTREGGVVEVSVDGGPWAPCRPALGYWWFDWNGGTPGTHRVAARLRSERGREVTTPPRPFRIQT